MAGSESTYEQACSDVESVLRNHSESLTEERAVLTGWVVVTEWALADGRRVLREMDSGLTPWNRRGMLEEFEDDPADLEEEPE